jgi:MFS-type transporter involved in bile tolerance (Atg22 family)
MLTYQRLILAALILTLGVVVLGAYVRLSDAGLGCPDWPGCYGKLTPHHASEMINQAQVEQPGGPVTHAKAWKEMAHRYFAGALGLLVLAIAVLAPIIGAAADKASAKKRFLVFFAYLGALATAALFWVGQGQWAWAIFCYALGIVGFSGANVFYDALLPAVAPQNRLDAISSLGYALGYLGGGLLFLLNVAMSLAPRTFGLADATAAVRLAFISA